MPVTTMKELYATLCSVVMEATGRKTWTKTGIQATPNFPYATVYLRTGDGFAQDVVVDNVQEVPGPNGETFQQAVLNTLHFQCVVEFFRNSGEFDTAVAAALRFKASLQLDARDFDLWRICGLTGPIQFIDVSAIFRADTEPRAQIVFGLYANLGNEVPVAGIDLAEIETQTVTSSFHRIDGAVFPIDTTVKNEGG